jgi:hypothetical protein
MQLPTRIAQLQSWIIQVLIAIWISWRWTNLLALGAGRFHTSWVQGIGAAVFGAFWLSAIIFFFVLNGLFGIDYDDFGPLDWRAWLLLPVVAFLASNLGCIFIGRFLFSKARVAGILAANDMPADSSIYDVGELHANSWAMRRYGFGLWLTTYAVGLMGLLTLLGLLLAFLGIAPPVS